MVAGFQSDGYRPRDELVYVMFTELGLQVMRFSMRDDRTMFLFTFADCEPSGTSANDLESQKALLRARFGKSGWECPQILDQLDKTCDLYFDRASQIRMDAEPGLWTRGAGDAARRCGFLRLAAGLTGFSASDGSGLYPGWRTASR